MHQTNTRQVQTCLKQSCQFASYQTRQVQTCLKIKQILNKSKLVLKNPVNIRRTKLDKSKLVSNNPVNSRQTKLDKFKLVLNNSVNSFSILFFYISF